MKMPTTELERGEHDDSMTRTEADAYMHDDSDNMTWTGNGNAQIQSDASEFISYSFDLDFVLSQWFRVYIVTNPEILEGKRFRGLKFYVNQSINNVIFRIEVKNEEPD